MEAARRLVGTLSHPLNRPRFDPRLQRVTEGYGVLQPRVQVSIESAARTTFAQVFSGHVGLDPYTTAVSDVYQDLFHEGSYVGKGIYDVDAFEAALAGRVPENALLSHDLFEGLYARAGLCTDIDLVDDYPSNYLAFAARQHRWVRGDWQIVRWLWRTVPGRERPRGAATRFPPWRGGRFSTISAGACSRRRSSPCSSPAGRCCPGPRWSGRRSALLVLAFPAYMQVGRSLTSRVRGVPLREHVLAERDNLAASATQAFLSTVFLLHQSWVMLDAIGRTLVRLLVTRRRMLEWVTADRVGARRGDAARRASADAGDGRRGRRDRGARRPRRARAAAARAANRRALVPVAAARLHDGPPAPAAAAPPSPRPSDRRFAGSRGRRGASSTISSAPAITG